MAHVPSLPWLLLCLGALSWSVEASVKWNVTNAINAVSVANPPGPQINQSPYNIDPNCNNIGTCTPYKFVLPNHTLWYWCGWSTTQRTDLDVTSSSASVTLQIMTATILNNCALSTPTTVSSGISSCLFVFGSQNTTSQNTPATSFSATQRVLGMAFSDEACIVLANSNNSPQSISLQVFQYYDAPRYYGTVFTVIYVIILIAGVCGYIGYTCYKEITQPIDRIAELHTFESQLLKQETFDFGGNKDDVTGADQDKDAADPGSFQGRVKNALSRAKNLVMRNKPSQA